MADRVCQIIAQNVRQLVQLSPFPRRPVGACGSVRKICDDILLRLPTLGQEEGCKTYEGLYNIHACVVLFSLFEWGRASCLN